MRERSNNGTPTKVLLDFDSTDDPAHGEQEWSAHHGYHRQRMYHPLLVLDGETDQLVMAVLRGGATHASKGALAVLRRILGRIREARAAASGGCACGPSRRGLHPFSANAVSSAA